MVALAMKPTDPAFPIRLCGLAHEAAMRAPNHLNHRDGFCLACAEIYVAYNKAVLEDPPVYDGPSVESLKAIERWGTAREADPDNDAIYHRRPDPQTKDTQT
jgi:hypothetical protein